MPRKVRMTAHVRIKRCKDFNLKDCIACTQGWAACAIKSYYIDLTFKKDDGKEYVRSRMKSTIAYEAHFEACIKEYFPELLETYEKIKLLR